MAWNKFPQSKNDFYAVDKIFVMDKKYFVIDKIVLFRTNLILSRTTNILSGQMDRARDCSENINTLQWGIKIIFKLTFSLRPIKKVCLEQVLAWSPFLQMAVNAQNALQRKWGNFPFVNWNRICWGLPLQLVQLIKIHSLPHLESFMWKRKYEKKFFKKSFIQPPHGVFLIFKLPFSNGSYHNGVCRALWAISFCVWSKTCNPLT